MPYIVREDGEHFVIPSYRDVLSPKNKAQLKKDILTLSESYGEYITLQRKGPNQYEVAFSPDRGYLLGESIWHHFKRPADMIYCEAIPNTTEAILVIVKSGSVYLDGSFPTESIPEELVIFLTQQNHFEIFVYGDVPIAEMPGEGKFSFETDSIKSFTVLPAPVFPTLPLLRSYQLQLVERVLRAHGIGGVPLKPLLALALLGGMVWLIYEFFSQENAPVIIETPVVNPYQGYNDALATPAPDQVMNKFITGMRALFTMPPGWVPVSIKYSNDLLRSSVKSGGTSTHALFNWAKQNNATVDIQADGVFVNLTLANEKRPVPTKIYPLKEVLSQMVDSLATVYPGNHLTLGEFKTLGPYTTVDLTINVEMISLINLALIGDILKGLPFNLKSIELSTSSISGLYSGTIILQGLGS